MIESNHPTHALPLQVSEATDELNTSNINLAGILTEGDLSSKQFENDSMQQNMLESGEMMKQTAMFSNIGGHADQKNPEYAFYSPDLNRKKSNPGHYHKEQENTQRYAQSTRNGSNSMGKFMMNPRRMDMMSSRG
jgi:hypothetical protein